MKKPINLLVLKILFILTPVFFIGYCSRPLVASYFISIKQANELNIKKFERNRKFFQEIVNSCIDIYEKHSKDYITNNDISVKMQNKLSNKGISFFEAKFFDSNNENINIIVVFHTKRFWKNNILNNVSIKYISSRKYDECNNSESNLNAKISIICLGNGWFFEIDTDWL